MHTRLLFGVLVSLCLFGNVIGADYGSCVCKQGGRGSGRGATAAEACTKAMKKCPTTNNCVRGYVCKGGAGKAHCRILRKVVKKKVDVQRKVVWRMVKGRRVRRVVVRRVIRFRCNVVCKSDGFGSCVKPGGRGDPHLVGFDGKKFDFHGVHNKFYALFGRYGGDLVVTKIRSARRWAKNGIEKTYFDQFGMRLNGGKDELAVSLVEDGAESGKWKTEVVLNGKVLSGDKRFDDSEIVLSDEDGAISVRSAENEYIVRAEKLDEEERRHLDIDVTLVNGPKAEHKYVGILGVTLNRAMGRETIEELGYAARDVELEAAMRHRFEVETLFAKVGDNDVTLSGVVRTADALPIRIVGGKSWKAMVRSN
ncbi:hypothetical protein FGB62_154g115 [Gracilaria domingensis]|nr:hypothetical protein FGB62_154g115 [Gracilaria domingensis]